MDEQQTTSTVAEKQEAKGEREGVTQEVSFQIPWGIVTSGPRGGGRRLVSEELLVNIYKTTSS